MSLRLRPAACVFLSFLAFLSQRKLLNKVFDFWMVIPSQKSENYEPP